VCFHLNCEEKSLIEDKHASQEKARTLTNKYEEKYRILVDQCEEMTKKYEEELISKFERKQKLKSQMLYESDISESVETLACLESENSRLVKENRKLKQQTHNSMEVENKTKKSVMQMLKISEQVCWISVDVTQLNVLFFSSKERKTLMADVKKHKNLLSVTRQNEESLQLLVNRTSQSLHIYLSRFDRISTNTPNISDKDQTKQLWFLRDAVESITESFQSQILPFIDESSESSVSSRLMSLDLSSEEIDTSSDSTFARKKADLRAKLKQVSFSVSNVLFHFWLTSV